MRLWRVSWALLLTLVILTVAVYVAAWVAPGVELTGTGSAVAVALTVAVLGAVVPPLIAVLPLPYTLPLGFLLVLGVDAGVLLLAADLFPDAVAVDSFWAALLASVLIAGAQLVVSMAVGVDEQAMALATVRRVARRQGLVGRGPEPGIVYLEIDGLARPVLERAIRSGHAPNLARWIDEEQYRLVGWETDLSSQTGASQAGILLGSNDDIPAFRWVEKERGRMVVCSSPADCALLEARHAGHGLLADGGASRGNLLSGEADEVILTVSRMDDERRRNPGYRAFLADGSNVTRTLALFLWEVLLEWLAAARQRRRGVVPRGHRGGSYPFLRAALCVLVRDLIVFGVLTDMARGRPAVYATFSSYDEVAHHSGLERPDTMEALRKLDERFGRIRRMAAEAPRPYEIVVLSDHGQTQGATFLQRNGIGLEDLVRQSVDAPVSAGGTGDEQAVMVDHAVREASGRAPDDPSDGGAVPPGDVAVLGSGNLGLVYLMDLDGRATLEDLAQRHPRLVPALREHPDIGWLMVRSAEHGPLVLGPQGQVRLRDGVVEGVDPLNDFGPRARQHLLRTDGFTHAPDVLVGSFYDAHREEGCAFEELISFHGGLGGPQTEAFLLHPPSLAAPEEPVVGAAAVHEVLAGWRKDLQHPPADRQARTTGSQASAPLPDRAPVGTLTATTERSRT
jgi:uncharacterized membrane protein YvlD (DUF360 family)